MFENTLQSINNCFMMQKGTYVLYRDFGLNVLDDSNPPLRRDIQEQISIYYPEVNLSNLTLNTIHYNGHSYYSVMFKRGN